MTKVEKIEQAIEQLSKSEFMQLRDWILERDWQSWDAQIERDAGAGKLDELIGESQEDYQVGRARKLLKADPHHPSLHFWIGTHADYDKLVGR
jgi:hypothetical protein